jgi:hypothetical protein
LAEAVTSTARMVEVLVNSVKNKRIGIRRKRFEVIQLLSLR